MIALAIVMAVVITGICRLHCVHTGTRRDEHLENKGQTW